jgi:putative membrane protein
MTRNILIVGAAIAALSLAACGQKADETKGAATPAEQAATPDANPAATVPTPSDETKADVFVAKAAASDMFEIEAAKLAAKRSTNAEVKKFAAMMAEGSHQDHRVAEGRHRRLGRRHHPADGPAGRPAGKLDDLTKADDKDFDKKYADSQVDAHQAALNLLQRYAQDGDTPAIKAFAAATAPTVQEHLNMAEGLKKGFDKAD